MEKWTQHWHGFYLTHLSGWNAPFRRVAVYFHLQLLSQLLDISSCKDGAWHNKYLMLSHLLKIPDSGLVANLEM